ncbi:MAG: glycosyltransferase family 4 protein [Nitrospirae bacterium]|nr:glycosyltransferase family 4 protein [Nitrospirota bacterium]
MKIVIVNRRYFESTGPERYFFGITERLEKDAHQVIPFAVRFKMNKKTPYERYFVSPIADEETLYYRDYKDKLNFIQKLRVASNAIYSFEAKKKIGQLIDDHGVDLVFLVGIANSISPSVIHAAKKRNIPVVMRVSDFFMFCAENTFLRDRKVCRECEIYGYTRAFKYKCLHNSLSVVGVRVLSMYIHRWLKVYDKVDAFITPSLCMREAFLKAGFPEEKLFHIPNFINVDNLAPKYENAGYMLYFGRIDMDKGVINLIKAYEKGGFHVPLLIAGASSDGEDKRLMEYVMENGIKNITFLGFKGRDELVPLIRDAMFTVVPSIVLDNNPQSVVESMACGKPVIGSDIGGISEQITSESGVLVPPGDIDAIREAIALLLSNPQKVIDMGRQARKRVEKEYSLENHYNKLISIFERLVANNRI